MVTSSPAWSFFITFAMRAGLPWVYIRSGSMSSAALSAVCWSSPSLSWIAADSRSGFIAMGSAEESEASEASEALESAASAVETVLSVLSALSALFVLSAELSAAEVCWLSESAEFAELFPPEHPAMLSTIAPAMIIARNFFIIDSP